MKNKILNKFKFWECIRCGHIWISNGKKIKSFKPKYCPNCKSPYWDRKRIKDMNILEKKQYRENKKLFLETRLPSIKIILKNLTNY